MKKAPVLMLAIFAGCLLTGCSKADDTGGAATVAPSNTPPPAKTTAGAGTEVPMVTDAGKNADKMTGSKAAGK